ncbi:MAG TPA: NAD(P)/FAD-dependent oxidoreductase [Clostridia bacterium]|nr:NAD(P)/FAD-dependent oxidoreductase [Clostridia bacterium]
MGKKILIAGAGHGGLVTGAYLAEKGFDVEVFEKEKRENLGYDWHDTIKNYTFALAGIKVNPEDIAYRKDNIFYPPSLGIEVIVPETPREKVDLEVDRKTLYDYLIDNAVSKGVKIHYEKKVNGPLIVNGKIAGLIVCGEEIKADLVIDAAGMYSPVRELLPESYGINSAFSEGDVFHAFRGYFNLIEGEKIVNPERFNVYFKFCNLPGIAWFKVTDGMADVLIGSVEPLDKDKVESVLAELRKAQPALGTTVLRGGQIKDIPLKSTLTLFIGDHYAAVGDSASMPYPLNGSGITNAVTAGKLLAETVIEAVENRKELNAEALWEYQKKYYKEIGAKMASVCVMKNCLLGYSVDALNFLFERKVLTEKELGAGTSDKELKLSFSDIMEKLRRGFLRPVSLFKLAGAGATARKAKAAALDIPEKYDIAVIRAWRKRVEEFLK